MMKYDAITAMHTLDTFSVRRLKVGARCATSTESIVYLSFFIKMTKKRSIIISYCVAYVTQTVAVYRYDSCFRSLAPCP